jgi:hypothetical protein
MRVLLAILSDGSASIMHAVSMMNLQTAVRAASANVHLSIALATDLRHAATLGMKNDNDAVVAVRSTLAFSPALVLRALVSPHQFVAGVYPLPHIDWDRVAARASDATEDTRYKGNVYNLDPKAARHVGGGYLAVPSMHLGATILKKEAMRCVAECTAGRDEDICAAWGGDIHADLDNQCAQLGPAEFAGCVGVRAVAAPATEISQKKISP